MTCRRLQGVLQTQVCTEVLLQALLSWVTSYVLVQGLQSEELQICKIIYKNYRTILEEEDRMGAQQMAYST